MNNEKPDCIFCKIVKGEIPAVKIWEDKKHIAILDINPYALGHVLVIPKEHYKWLWDMPKKDYVKLTEDVLYLANVLRKTFETEWVEEVVAGIGVEHVHIHLLPRQKDDGLGEIPIKPVLPKLTMEEREKVAEEIKRNLGK